MFFILGTMSLSVYGLCVAYTNDHLEREQYVGASSTLALGCVQALRCHKNTCPSGIVTQDKKLQKVLKPEDKAVKVANYCGGLVKEVEIIAHSCGVAEPRQLRPFHVDIVQDTGRSVSLADLYPELKF